MSIPVLVNGTLQGLDFTQPDNVKIVWPMPRNMKMDMYEVLTQMLQQFKLDIPVIAEGTFKQSMLKDKDQQQRPVICISRAGDTAERFAIGEVAQFLIYDSTANPPQLVDITDDIIKNLFDGEPVTIKGQTSRPSIEVEIYDMNLQRVEAIYTLVKTIFIATENTFLESLNYLDFIRSDGVDEAPLVLNLDGGTHPVFQRTLTYRGHHFDFVEGLPSIVNLIQETFTGLTVDPSGNSSETVNL